MRITVITGIFAFVAVVATHAPVASAQIPNVILNKNLNTETSAQTVLNTIESKSIKPVAAVKPPVTQEIGPNDSLSTIAKHYDTTWVRLFYKNLQLSNPDILVVGEKLTIPLPDEQLAERPLPEPPKIVPVKVTLPQSSKNSKSVRDQSAGLSNASANNYRGGSAGNSYSPGYCTWYAKNMRPDLPNNLGNANTWVGSAAAQGIPTGSAPRVGAIGQQGMHVVYVQQVNGDGTVTISEMNYGGLYVIGTRTVPASNFQYIY